MLRLRWIYWLNLTVLPYKLTSWSTNCFQWRNFGIVNTVDGCFVNIILYHPFNMSFGLQIKFPDLWSQQHIALVRNLILCFLDGRNVISLNTGVIQCQYRLWQWILWNSIPEIFRSCHLPIFCYCNPSFLPFSFLSLFQQIFLSISHVLWAQGSWQGASKTQVFCSYFPKSSREDR